MTIIFQTKYFKYSWRSFLMAAAVVAAFVLTTESAQAITCQLRDTPTPGYRAYYCDRYMVSQSFLAGPSSNITNFEQIGNWVTWVFYDAISGAAAYRNSITGSAGISRISSQVIYGLSPGFFNWINWPGGGTRNLRADWSVNVSGGSLGQTDYGYACVPAGGYTIIVTGRQLSCGMSVSNYSVSSDTATWDERQFCASPAQRRTATLPSCEPRPTADIKANGSDGPITIPPGSSATLSWTSANASSCTASGDWSGTKATSGSQTTGSLTASKVYTIACAGPGGTSSPDSVAVNVSTPPTYQCSDSRDNDGDGQIDYPADPGCSSSTDNDETDPAPILPPATILRTFSISPQDYHPGDTVTGTAILEVASPVTASFRIELYKDGQLFWSRDINSIYLAAQTYTVPLETILGFNPTLPDSPSLYGNWLMKIIRRDVSETLSQSFSIAATQRDLRTADLPVESVIGTLVISPKNYGLGQTLTGSGAIINRNATAVPASFRIVLTKGDRTVWTRQIGPVLLNPGTLNFSLNDVFGFTPTIPASDFFLGNWRLEIAISAGGDQEPRRSPGVPPSYYEIADNFTINRTIR